MKLNFFKKAEVKETKEPTESQIRIADKLKELDRYVNYLDHSLATGVIDSGEYEYEMGIIESRIDEICETLGETSVYQERFDEMMGKPVQMLDELFNTRVHEAIDSCERKDEK